MATSEKETSPIKPSLTIVIVTFNRPHLAQSLALSIRKNNNDSEIIIVDQENTSQCDNEVLMSNAIQYCNLEKGHISKARNEGVNKTKGDIILFLDDDVEITQKTIVSHLSGYSHDAIVGVAGRVINDGEEIPNNTEVATGKTNFLRSFFIQNFYSTKKQSVDFPYGCNMSFRRLALQSIGGFDEYYSRIFDDIDVALSLSKEGSILFEPEALVLHHKAKGGGIRKAEEQKERLIYRNYGHLIAKHVPLPLSLITLGIRTITALKTYPSAVFSLLQGYGDFFTKKRS